MGYRFFHDEVRRDGRSTNSTHNCTEYRFMGKFIEGKFISSRTKYRNNSLQPDNAAEDAVGGYRQGCEQGGGKWDEVGCICTV